MPSEAPTSRPSLTPTVNPEVVQAVDEILVNLVPTSVLFANEATPQYRAREWFLKRDLLRDDAVADGEVRVLQRYSLCW